ncbi:MAG: mercury(II) reductase [Candidatus Marsarchaeota archaeon]|nr:mercury(II) reductase [Candidatus Marsarchaeota archaeon]MCL5095069.1 mercury(II) reductase [Candidatus Marsarchaeota archaeon]
MERFDYIIIGHGAAAFSAAIKADSMKINTAMIGKNETPGALLGGTCVNVGCVPSKRLISVGEFIKNIKNSKYSGVKAKVEDINFQKIIMQKDEIVNEFRAQKYTEVLKNLKHVTYINEFASFKDKNTVIAGNKELYSKSILIATGARSMVPNLAGIENVKYLTNEEALSIKHLPKSLIVVGGRALGLEFAQMFSNFGVKVTLLQRSSSIIPAWEPEIINYLTQYLKQDGIEINTNVELKEIGEKQLKKYIKARVNGADKLFTADEILFATGRKPNIEKLHLENPGIILGKQNFIKINNKMETNVKGIYAAGDVTGEPMLETVAAKQGNLATQNIFKNANKSINFNEIPFAIFTMPEAAKVGLTDEQVNGKGIKCSCNTILFSMIPKATIIGDERGLIKIVINNNTKQILGVSILSRNAADLIAEAALAVKFKLKIDDIIDTVHVFPTLSEAIKLASQNFYQDISKLSCCTI